MEAAFPQLMLAKAPKVSPTSLQKSQEPLKDTFALAPTVARLVLGA